MAPVSMILGGIVGFLTALLAWILGSSFLLALAIWSGTGLIVAVALILIGLLPRHPAQDVLIGESA